ncbi:MAG: hypothetical protein AB7E55_23310 [Pigmentiphaga sp.]
MMKKRLIVLVDSPRYIRSNCYQSQLMATLKSFYRVEMISADRIAHRKEIAPRDGEKILSVLRLRTLQRLLPELGYLLGDIPIWVYEQDPWHAFMDESPHRGAYRQTAETLNVVSYLNTSLWWSEYIRGQGLPSVFVRMGMLPEFCDVGKVWEKRSIAIGFQGTIHPHRRKFFGALAAMGVSVTVLESASYKRYLKRLHDIQIYVHTENDPWVLQGVPTPRNALWIKDTEVAARGCFAIRNHEDEAEAYDISELPTIFTFREVAEVPDIIERIQSMPSAERAERMRTSVERMRQRNDWMTVVDAIEGRRT